jgi:predicted RNA-binding Zn-ribbon protein involved in translation (DUF1610 family)
VSEGSRTRDEASVHGNSDDYVAFHTTEEAATGGFRCSACGYGVVVATVLPLCPMCGGETWEADPSRSLGRFSAEI